ncbi:MAG TPA: sigma-70 family RNA polymerase sigma factor [Bryobacteraceae bacterium]|nr:sigma-70 family RNA polymerase sigma factor [Bryobacteraceae bacterium]
MAGESFQQAAGVGIDRGWSTGARDALWRSHLEGVRAGRQEALAALYDESSSLVYTIVLRIVGNREDAEEVMLDVYSQVWRSASGYQPDRGTVTGWLTMLARSRAIDRVRARARSVLDETLEIVAETADPGSTPEEQTAIAEEQARVRAALVVLPEEQRRLLELACYSGFTQSELAARLGLPLGTVKTRMRLGMMRLREELGSLARGIQ